MCASSRSRSIQMALGTLACLLAGEIRFATYRDQTRWYEIDISAYQSLGPFLSIRRKSIIADKVRCFVIPYLQCRVPLSIGV